MSESTEPPQKRRLLRLTVSHYRPSHLSEEEFRRFVTEEHAVQAAKLHAKNGIEDYSVCFSPSSFRDTLGELNTKYGNPWAIRDYDVTIQFLFRDMETFLKGAADPDFQALQAAEKPYASGIPADACVSWIETYVSNGKVVNVSEDGKTCYPKFGELNVPLYATRVGKKRT